MMLGVRDDVRTPAPVRGRNETSKQPSSETETEKLFLKHVDEVVSALNEPECAHILPNIRMLKDRFREDQQAAA
jgi:hypothetical protein